MKLTEETSVEIIDWKKLPLKDIQIYVSGKGNVVLSVSPASQGVRTSAAILTTSTRMHCAGLDGYDNLLKTLMQHCHLETL